jgi:hypothetical protein
MTDQTRRDTSEPPPAHLGEHHPPLLDRQIQGRIGEHLRALYDGLMQQPVPDRFRDLIARLEDGPTVVESD